MRCCRPPCRWRPLPRRALCHVPLRVLQLKKALFRSRLPRQRNICRNCRIHNMRYYRVPCTWRLSPQQALYRVPLLKLPYRQAVFHFRRFRQRNTYRNCRTHNMRCCRVPCTWHPSPRRRSCHVPLQAQRYLKEKFRFRPPHRKSTCRNHRIHNKRCFRPLYMLPPQLRESSCHARALPRLRRLKKPQPQQTQHKQYMLPIKPFSFLFSFCRLSRL